MLVLSMGGILRSNAQETRLLQMGDAAPALTYSKWIQGSPQIKALAKDQIYVLEFWATWCGPCIQAMPHLSELSQKYKGRISFIGVDVWENSHDFGEKKKPQEKYLPKVIDFVKGQKARGRLLYNVVADNNAEDMAKTWLKAAGLEGIPSSFVIQNGKIVWIGHPYYLDSILTAVNAGTFDVEGTKKKMEEAKLQRAKSEAQLEEGHNLYKQAMADSSWDKAVQLIDTAIARYPNFSYKFAEDKWNILRKHYSEDSLLAYGQKLGKDHFLGQMVVIWLYYDSTFQSPRLKEFAIHAAKGLDPEGKNFRVWNILADLQARAGHFKDAAASARKAAAVAKSDMSSKGSDGAVTQTDIDEFLKKADEFEKKAAKGGGN